MAITSYLTPAEAVTLLAELLDKDVFASGTVGEQQQALNSATVAINNLDYLGDKTVSTQANEFPRDSAITIPDAILLATALEANELLDGKANETEWESDFLQSVTYAGVNSKYSAEHKDNIIVGIVSVEAFRQIKPFLKSPHDLEIDIS